MGGRGRWRGAPRVFFALVGGFSIHVPSWLPRVGVGGWGGRSMQLRAGQGWGKGKQEKQQAAQERGEQAGRVQGWLLG